MSLHVVLVEPEIHWNTGNAGRSCLAAGAELHLQYRHHIEACYCLDGEAEIEDLATGERHHIGPGVLYALDKHDAHVLRVTRDLRLVCVFNPPLTGGETHDAQGGYLPSD